MYLCEKIKSLLKGRSETKPRQVEVVEAIDGPILLNESVADPDNCEFSEEAPLRPVWCEVQSTLVNQLENATFDKFGPDYS
jgi:DNA-binding IscR family transcriptional regulator